MSAGLGLYVGDSQTLIYGSGANEIVVLLESNNFKPGEGKGFEPQIGYDRVRDAEYRRSSKRSTLGTPYWQGPSFSAPHQFAWRLQLLTDQQLWGLDAIAARQQRDMGRVKLVDQRLALCEPQPRSSAKKGAVLSGQPDMVCYWPQFWIELELGERFIRESGDHELTMVGRELDLVPLSEDLT
jgi:hypothetical protein